jgi:ornithine cyclodeaminase/alanine dehydrogenase-like protein (mu-crystallin family)
MPALEERLRLAELTMTALARPGAAELPPKIAIHPRPEASFVHAMPSHLRGDTPAGDLVGMKWVAGYATNTARGLPGIHATVVVNDPQTGIPTAILDGGPITAERTAAVSGVGLRHFGPAAGGAVDIAMIGAGVQGRSHLPVFAGLLPGARIRIFDRSPERAAALASVARAMPGIAAAEVAASAR